MYKFDILSSVSDPDPHRGWGSRRNNRAEILSVPEVKTEPEENRDFLVRVV